ncbi:MAG: hypothetical protein M1829_004964 [Trizodia sp. TS-e1964]|nr:MAG: hypothetical protein M1829_004964 [Trizodia sp. TS-e1964]
MGKAGRFACIFTPMALTIAALICMVLIGLGGTNKNDKNLSGLWFFRADLSNFTTSVDLIPGTNLDNQLLAEALATAKKDSNLKDVYTVSLWNYCNGTKTDGDNFRIDDCGKPSASFWFNPVAVWGLNNTVADKAFPDALKNALSAYQRVAQWMFTAYAVAFIATAVELLFGFLAIFSRWGSLATTICGSIASLFILAASITSTVLYSALAGSFDSYLKPFGIQGSLGRPMYTLTWLAVAFSWAAGLFWLFSVCCCSGRSNSPKRVKVEKAPYTYERVESPAHGQYGDHVPLHPMPAASGKHGGAYEPYRHEHV